VAGAGLSGLVARRVDALFGQEDVVLRLAAGLDEGGVPAEGWRIRREGARVTIRRGLTPWERLWRGGLFGLCAFEYRLEGRLAEGAVLRGRILVVEPHRAAMMVFLGLAGVVFPLLGLVVVVGGTVRELAVSGPGVASAVGVLLRALGAAAVFAVVAVALLAVLLGLGAVMRRLGAANRAALVALLAGLGERR
jgi:hypothetical protein